jgi:hypothetical protein
MRNTPSGYARLNRRRGLNGEPLPRDAATRPLDDPWEGIVDTAAAGTKLGFRPIFPTVYGAKAAPERSDLSVSQRMIRKQLFPSRLP